MTLQDAITRVQSIRDSMQRAQVLTAGFKRDAATSILATDIEAINAVLDAIADLRRIA